jgi:dihydroorotase
MRFDILIKGGTVLDPASNLERPLDVGVSGGKITALEGDLPVASAREVLQAEGTLVTPGLFDFHTHVFHKGNPFSVDPDIYGPEGGITTLVDAGTAGAANFRAFRDYVIRPAKVRILAFLNISFIGQPFFPGMHEGIAKYEMQDIRFGNVPQAVETIKENREWIKGVKVRLSNDGPASPGIAPLELALEAAEETGLPVMVHVGAPPPSLRDILFRLRPGDILAHCYRAYPNAILRHGTVLEIVREARERGVILDIAHGLPHFDLEIARLAIAQGFYPDVISTDITTYNQVRVVYNMPTTLSKFVALGMELRQVIAAATINPARALGLHAELGSLQVGASADVTVLGWERGSFKFEDVQGHVVRSDRRLQPLCTLSGGKLLYRNGSLS